MTKSSETLPTAERSASYYQRQVSSGLVRVSTWIPRAGRNDFDLAVDALYVQWQKDGLLS